MKLLKINTLKILKSFHHMHKWIQFFGVFFNFRYWFWVIMFNQRGLLHSMVYMKRENKAHITNQCHYKHIRLSLTIIFGYWEVGKKYTVCFTFIFKIMKKWFHNITYILSYNWPKKKKAFLRNILNLLGFKIIAIKC